MRVKRLTGLLPAIISTALQVSLKTEGAPHPPGSIPLLSLPVSLGCHEFVSSQPVTRVKPVAVFGIFLTPCYNHPGCGFGRGVCVSGGIPMDTSPPQAPPLCRPGPSGSASRAVLQHPWAVAWRRPRRVATATEPSLSIPPSLQLRRLGRSWVREQNPRGHQPFPPPQLPGSGWQARGWGN